MKDFKGFKRHSYSFRSVSSNLCKDIGNYGGIQAITFLMYTTFSSITIPYY